MSRLVKIALILGVAAVAIAARQLTLPNARSAAESSAVSISPSELMEKSGPLPETEVYDYN
jgi:hypothetical protein